MISVCLATYNGETYLKEQLDSILKQLDDDDEVVVSDDGSTDSTLRILSEFNDPRIRVFHHSKEKQKFAFDYVTHNFENAIRHCKGEIVFLADQDDVWLEGRVKICKESLQNSDLVLSDCKVVDSELKEIHPSYFSLNRSKKGIFANLIHNSYLGCCMAFKKEFLEECNAFPFPKSLVPHDIWLGLLAEIYGKVTFLSTPTVLYRRHERNVSSSSVKSELSLSFKIYYRFAILIALIKRYWGKKN